MESTTNAPKSNRFLGSPYLIYGAEEENIYETIKKKKLQFPEMYDEVFQSKPSCKDSEPQQMCGVIFEDQSPPNYGEFRVSKCTNLIKKLYNTVPFWVKISIPIIIICVTVVFNGILITEVKLLTQTNKSATKNTSISLPPFFTPTTEKTISPTFANITSTITEEVTTTTTTEEVTTTTITWNYTNSSWYIQSDSFNTYYCDTWELISTVKFQPLDLQGTICYNIPDCVTFIDLYKHNSKEKANYTFYIDRYGNIYQGRDWYCPYVSGELWVALLTNSFNIFQPKSELQLRHYYEMVSYKRAVEFFDDNVEEEFVRQCSLDSHTNSSCANV